MVRPASPAADATAKPADTAGGRRRSPDNSTEAAVARARGQLGHLRQQFLQGRLPPLGHLIVRHRLAIPGGSEAPWVLTRSWRVRAWLEGRCLNDAVHPSLAHIRMGRAVVVDADQVVDWAIVDAFGSIIDGGWSRDLRWAPPPPEHRTIDAQATAAWQSTAHRPSAGHRPAHRRPGGRRTARHRPVALTGPPTPHRCWNHHFPSWLRSQASETVYLPALPRGLGYRYEPCRM
ncbi:hypothetical protein [Pseudofrankia sp. DC12]|uniref:hypothetical protein n=1 Tax=Pseudofrankia sp. DC12 TaxID=683315 RepID=UPI000A82FBA4|nr:hypothetical protein [Pseudofrankia sp. DC12]